MPQIVKTQREWIQLRDEVNTLTERLHKLGNDNRRLKAIETASRQLIETWQADKVLTMYLKALAKALDWGSSFEDGPGSYEAHKERRANLPNKRPHKKTAAGEKASWAVYQRKGREKREAEIKRLTTHKHFDFTGEWEML